MTLLLCELGTCGLPCDQMMQEVSWDGHRYGLHLPPSFCTARLHSECINNLCSMRYFLLGTGGWEAWVLAGLVECDVPVLLLGTREPGTERFSMVKCCVPVQYYGLVNGGNFTVEASVALLWRGHMPAAEEETTFWQFSSSSSKASSP